MDYKKRVELEKRYYEYLDNHLGSKVKDCPVNVMAFLDNLGYLRDEPEEVGN